MALNKGACLLFCILCHSCVCCGFLENHPTDPQMITMPRSPAITTTRISTKATTPSTKATTSTSSTTSMSTTAAHTHGTHMTAPTASTIPTSSNPHTTSQSTTAASTHATHTTETTASTISTSQSTKMSTVTYQSTKMPTITSGSTTPSEIVDLRRQMQELVGKINKLEQENTLLGTKVTTLESQINHLNSLSPELLCARQSVQDVDKNVQFLLQRLNNTSGIVNPPATCPSLSPTHTKSNMTGHPRDCYDILINGDRSPGVYDIKPGGATQSIKAYCDSGWTYIMRRNTGKLRFSFGLHWENFVAGFGDVDEEYWLGNDNIYKITKQTNYSLRIEAHGWTNKFYWAQYTTFFTDNEANNYQLHIDGFHGNYKDPMEDKNRTYFSTQDKDNDNGFGNCANIFGAWWYGKCLMSPSGMRQDHLYMCMGFADRCVKDIILKIKPTVTVSNSS